jgi:iron complex outermembrane receptor protein
MTHRRLFFLFSLATATYAAEIIGRVQDSQNAAIAQARVTIYSQGFTHPTRTLTDSAGSFRILVPDAPAHWVTAETSALASPEPLRIEANAQPITLTLRPTAQRAAIQVTADATPTAFDETGKALDVLDFESLQRRNEIFLLESLRLTAGTQVQQIGGPGSTARIVTRGLRTADTSILIDGFRFRDTTSTQGEAAGLLPDLMVVNPDRFEVCRGSESTLYGTHAVGGVINIVTNPGGGPTHGELSFEGGGLGLLRGLAKASGGQGRFQWTGAVAHTNVLNGIDGTDAYRNTGAQAFGRFALTSKSSLSARLFSTDAFSQYNSGPGARAGIALPAGTIPGTLAFYNPQQNDPDARRATRTWMTLVGLDHQFTSKLTARLQYNRLHTNRFDINGPGGTGFQAAFRDFNQFQGALDTIAARLNYNWSRQQNLIVGYEFEREHFYNFGDDNNPNAARRNTRQVGINQYSSSVYAQQQFRLWSRLIVNLSGRVQTFQLRQPNFFGAPAFYGNGDLSSPPRAVTGDASIAYLFPTSNTKLRAHVGNAYRAPSLYERFGTALFSGRYSIYGDPNLRPDRAISLDFGIDQYLFNSKAKIAATYFYTGLQEVIGFGPVPREPFGRTSGYFNTGGGLARGVELSASLQPTRKWSLQSSYTYTSTLERRPIFLTGELASQRVFPHTFAVTSTYFITPNWDVTADYFQASSYLVPFFVSTGGQFGSRAFRFGGPRKADIASRYRIPLTDRQSLELYTRLENITNRTYYEAGYLTPGFWGTAGLRWRF